MTASDFVNCSRTQSLVAHPDTSSTAAGIRTPIFIICRIKPPPLWTLTYRSARMRTCLGEQQPRQGDGCEGHLAGKRALGRYGLYLACARPGWAPTETASA